MYRFTIKREIARRIGSSESLIEVYANSEKEAIDKAKSLFNAPDSSTVEVYTVESVIEYCSRPPTI